MDVIQFLKKDHKKVHSLFKEFEELSGSRSAQKKSAIVDQICQALTAHAQVEEELVYPALQENRSLKDLLCEAKEEHQVAKRLVSELEQLQPDAEQYNAKVKVLCEYVMHHVKEEEKEIFPLAQKRLSGKRLEALGVQVEERHNELMDAGEEREDKGKTLMKSAKMRDGSFEDEEDVEEESKAERGRRRVA